MGCLFFNSNRRLPLTASLMSLLYKMGQEEDILSKCSRSVSVDSFSVRSSDSFIVESDSEKKEAIDKPSYMQTISSERLFLYRVERYLIDRLKRIGEAPSKDKHSLQGSSESKKLNELLSMVGKAKKTEKGLLKSKCLLGAKEKFEDRIEKNIDLQKKLDDHIATLLKQAKVHRNFFSFFFPGKPESYKVLYGLFSDCNLKNTVLKDRVGLSIDS